MNRQAIALCVAIVLVCPSLFLIGMAALNQHAIQQEKSFILPITGYDPRDPVFGHYFQFQIQWPWRKTRPVTCFEKAAECRVCLQMIDPTHPHAVTVSVVPQAHATAQHCAAVIGQIDSIYPGDNDTSSRLNAPPSVALKNAMRRFYIDETDGPWLEAYFRDHPDQFAVEVKIHQDRMHLQNLLINGRNYREVMREKQP